MTQQGQWTKKNAARLTVAFAGICSLLFFANVLPALYLVLFSPGLVALIYNAREKWQDRKEATIRRALEAVPRVQIPPDALHTGVRYKRKLIYPTIEQGLVALDASGVGIRDLQELQGLPALAAMLQVLRLEENLIQVVPNLTFLPNLVALFLDDNQITNFRGLGSLPQLRVLSAEGNRIWNGDGLAELPHIEQLWLRKNQIPSIAMFTSLTRLRVLMLAGNPIVEHSGIDQLPLLHKTSLSPVAFTNPQVRQLEGGVYTRLVQFHPPFLHTLKMRLWLYATLGISFCGSFGLYPNAVSFVGGCILMLLFMPLYTTALLRLKKIIRATEAPS